MSLVCHRSESSSSRAALRSCVSKPSVNRSKIGASSSRGIALAAFGQQPCEHSGAGDSQDLACCRRAQSIEASRCVSATARLRCQSGWAQLLKRVCRPSLGYWPHASPRPIGDGSTMQDLIRVSSAGGTGEFLAFRDTHAHTSHRPRIPGLRRRASARAPDRQRRDRPLHRHDQSLVGPHPQPHPGRERNPHPPLWHRRAGTQPDLDSCHGRGGRTRLHAGRRGEPAGDRVACHRQLGADVALPGFANMLQGELGLQPMETSSHQGVCAAGVSAFKHAAMALALRHHEHALVVAAEFPSRMFKRSRFMADGYSADFDSHFLRWMLSDGAGAFLLSRRPRNEGLSLALRGVHLKSFSGDLPVCMQVGLPGQERTACPTSTIRPWRRPSAAAHSSCARTSACCRSCSRWRSTSTRVWPARAGSTRPGSITCCATTPRRSSRRWSRTCWSAPA